MVTVDTSKGPLNIDYFKDSNSYLAQGNIGEDTASAEINCSGAFPTTSSEITRVELALENILRGKLGVEQVRLEEEDPLPKKNL